MTSIILLLTLAYQSPPKKAEPIHWGYVPLTRYKHQETYHFTFRSPFEVDQRYYNRNEPPEPPDEILWSDPAPEVFQRFQPKFRR